MIRRAAKALAASALVVTIILFAIFAFPSAVGADQSYIVLSGSMEPAIPTGSAAFVKDVPAERIEEGDVITFSKTRDSSTTTHRVIEKHTAGDSLRFVTKGDNNDSPDPEPVYRGEVVGVVTFSIPFIGYLVRFGNSSTGWIVLVVLPAFLLVANELWELYNALEPEGESENSPETQPIGGDEN